MILLSPMRKKVQIEKIFCPAHLRLSRQNGFNDLLNAEGLSKIRKRVFIAVEEGANGGYLATVTFLASIGDFPQMFRPTIAAAGP